MLSLLIFFIIISILILIHEFGHFISAKLNGVKVEEFGFGLPPRIFGIKKGETIYSINLFPFGGFVKLFGEEYHEIDNNIKSKKILNKAFINKNPWQKIIIILAGVIMNFLLAIGIFYFLLIKNGFQSNAMPLFYDYKFKFGQQEKKVIVINVNKDSPAYEKNIQTEDIVLEYKSNNQWRPILNSTEFIKLINKNKDKQLTLKIQNNQNGEEKIIDIKPIFNKNLNRYIIGITLTDAVILKYQSKSEKLLSGFFHSYNLLNYNLEVLNKIIINAIKEKKPENITQTVSGPIGIFAIVSETVKSSGKKLFDNLLDLTALLSLSLGFMNVLPFPALDGGRLIFVLYELITGKKNHQTIEKYLNFFGFLFLIFLAILISINDFLKFFK